MSRLEELKKQNPKMGFNVIDLINSMIPKPKYTELMVNLVKRKSEGNNNDRQEIVSALKNYDIVFNYDEYSTLELHIIYRIFDVYVGSYDLQTLKKFVELNERNLIKDNNLSTFKSFDDLRLQISLAELKLIDKDIEKQVIKLYESSDWLVIKPLSWNSSRKYGANTKWCTASEQEPDYYYKYAKKGILIYAINKNSGDKVAGFCQISTYDDRELSFWNMVDRRIDSIEANLPDFIMDIFKKEFNKETKVSNWGLLSREEQEKQENWLHLNGYYVPNKIVELHPDEVPEMSEDIPQINAELTQEYERLMENEAVPEPIYETRIVRMRG